MANDHKQDENEQLEQNKGEKQYSYTGRVLTIGFVGGLFWSLIGYAVYMLNFTRIRPSLVLSPWAVGDWKDKALGDWIGILVIGLLSMLVAIVYKVLFSKFKHMVTGIIFGIVLWGIVFFLFNPMFPTLKPIQELGINTLITTLCLYVLYGLFVGFSISFDYDELQKAQKQGR
ncbi:YqhR family membrane protein [Pseudalkalibacillus berkeleyi]|uniref:YqhR family membrane protein n=1 Tax=Pseudalkalibacillus berkeleyi TaxID=1069813 RepID=A0ABS9H1A7_9BACL|nr:YqhR family membrane protein [Pseudalkalibacillus berkeleyi]MCF6137866.1 YqhR family membrane protein [Pseudalkalibacillus berkeleyi]